MVAYVVSLNVELSCLCIAFGRLVADSAFAELSCTREQRWLVWITIFNNVNKLMALSEAWYFSLPRHAAFAPPTMNCWSHGCIR